MKDAGKPSFLIDMRPLIILAALAALTSQARAESDDKSATVATVASIGATVGPIALAFVNKDEGSAFLIASAGLVLGPSVGHWYAGESGWRGLAIRGAGVTLMGATITTVGPCHIGDGGEEGKDCDTAETVFMAGAAIFIGGVIYDWATAGSAAKRHNARTVQIAPTMVSGTRSTGAGLGVSGAF